MSTPEQLSHEYRETRARIRELCGDLTDEQAATTVPACPDWTVHDLLAHLAGNAAEPVSGNIPGDDIQAWTDAAVERRKDVSPKELLDEWDEAGPAFEDIIVQFGTALRNVVYDAVTHEHDLRHALDRPGERDSAGMEVVLEALLDQLHDRVRERDLPAVRVTASDTGEERVCGEGEPGLSISLPRFDLCRILSNRRSEAQVRAAPWKGGVEPYLPALEASPFPEHDIVE